MGVLFDKGGLVAAAGLLAFTLLACASSPEQSLPTPSASMPAGVRPTLSPEAEARFAQERLRMVEKDIRGRDVTDERVLAAMARIPRHRFVPEAQRDNAYADRPLPIGFWQTISQPYIVGIMTQLLDLKEGDKVLEVGTGSGYQAAVLAELTPNVYTIEIIEGLAERAKATLRELGYDKVRTVVGDGYYGWEEHAPYDAILVTCAPDHIPQPLVQQLKDGGRLVIPVGPPGLYQSLWKIERRGDQILSKNVMGVAFVPMTGVAERD